MKYLLPFLFLFLLGGCITGPAKVVKKLNAEQLKALKELVEIKKSSGCYRGGIGAGMGPAEAEAAVAGCWGTKDELTVNEAVQLMNGVSVTIKP